MNHQDTKTPRRKPEPVSSAIDEVARQVVDAAYTVHHELGPGLLETSTRRALVVNSCAGRFRDADQAEG